MRLKFFLTVLTSFLFYCSNAQDGFGSWNIVNAKINIDHHWSFFGEAQIRSLGLYKDFHYYEYKVGANYTVDNNFSIGVGAGQYHTYSPGGNFKNPKVTDENRTWLQIGMSQYLERIKFDHRFRIEQRWLNNVFHNRLRYRLNAVLPLNHKKLDPKTVYLSLFDELFLSDQHPHLERNRVFFGAGYVYTSYFTFQLGILNQRDYKLTSESDKNYLQLSLLYELAFKKKKKENMPGNED